jgi:hypothetical protein
MQRQEAAMAVKRRASTGKAERGPTGSSMPADVIASVADLVASAQAATAPVTKRARRRIQELGRQLDAARAVEAKRLRQSAKARLKVEKRERQATDAASAVASIVLTIRDEAGVAIGRKAGATAAKAAAKPAAVRSAVEPAAAKTANMQAAAKPAGKPAAAARPASPTRSTDRRRTKPKPTA